MASKDSEKVSRETRVELIDIDYLVDEISEYIEKHDINGLRNLIKSIRPQDLVDVVERLDSSERRLVLGLIPSDYYVEILRRLPEDILYEVVVSKGVSKIARIMSDMQPDEIADILEKLPLQIRRRVLALLPPWKINEVTMLMKYPPESAGGVMTTRIPVFGVSERVGNVLEEYTVKYQLGLYDKLNYIYVVDKDGKLVGWIEFRNLITAPRDKELKEIVQPCPAKVHVLADREEAARLVIKYDLVEIPVVDDEGKLLGAITVDDIIDVIVAESTEDILKFGGIIKAIKGSYLTAKITELVKRRAIWLIILYMLESITITVISRFETLLASVVALSFFIPLLTDTGGNTGSQSATLVIRSLATGEARVSDFIRIFFKELAASSLLALIISPIGFVIAYTISHQILIALTVSIALGVIIVIASLVGITLPFIALLFKFDPAVISAPLITTVADVTGITLYFTIASYLLHI